MSLSHAGTLGKCRFYFLHYSLHISPWRSFSGIALSLWRSALLVPFGLCLGCDLDIEPPDCSGQTTGSISLQEHLSALSARGPVAAACPIRAVLLLWGDRDGTSDALPHYTHWDGVGCWLGSSFPAAVSPAQTVQGAWGDA